MAHTPPYDLIIIGGSAAASAAAVYAVRRNLNFRIISKEFGGEVATAGEIENYLGFPRIDGIKLSNVFRAHLRSYDIKPELGVTIRTIRKEKDVFLISGRGCAEPVKSGEKLGETIEGDECAYRAKSVIIATGGNPRELGIPGEKEYRGRGVTYCTVCDGPLFRGKATATIGGGNSGIESSIIMAGIAKKHFIIHKNAQFGKGDPLLISHMRKTGGVTEIMNAQTTEIIGDGKKVTGMKYKDSASGEEKEIAVDGIFIHIGMVPNSALAPPDVLKNDFNEIRVDSRCATNIPGLFAAGDVTDVPYNQIGIAAGQGIIAALSAAQYLQKQQ